MGPARILVVEDNALDVILLRHALDQQHEKYEIEVLTDGEEAIRFVREYRAGTREPEPCVILLDLYLPAHDGLAVLRAIRQAPALDHVQVVVLTSIASPRQGAEIETMRALYRAKPTALAQLAELAEFIMEICRNSAQAA